jgi:hypothetical protein
MPSYRETVYLGRDNDIILGLAQGDEVINAGGVTRCQLVFKRPDQADITIDSNVVPALFNLQAKAQVNGVETGVLVLKLGEVAGVPADLYAVDVYLFDAANDDGVFWDTIEMLVRDGDT